jgi:hypothetical protein
VGPHSAGSAAEQLRTAEVIATLCLATDLGMGFPFEHGLHTTVIAMRLADRLGVDCQTAGTDVFTDGSPVWEEALAAEPGRG